MDLRPGSLWMAPMAGVTDKPFRELVREQGCALTFTEMISGKAIQYNNRRTWKMLDLAGEHPIGVQLFGSDPQVMADAARVAQDQGADIIDINMGCPVLKVVGNGEGAALMRKPELASAIVRAVRDAVTIPVSVKIRTGWDEKSRNAVSFAQDMARSGAEVVTVHARTREQMYSGTADWEIIAQVVRAVDIPVVGNGDVWSGEDAREIMAQTGCAGVMLARGVMGNPWLFAEAAAAMAQRDYKPPSVRERIELAIRHFRMELSYRDEKKAVLFMRKHLAWYLKGLPGTGGIKKQIFILDNSEEIVNMLREYAKTE